MVRGRAVGARALRLAIAGGVAGAAVPVALGAQGARAELPARAPGGRECAPVAHVLSLAVRRRDGTPVPDAVLTVRDGRDGSVLARRARGSADGLYLVLGGDGEPPTVPAAGLPLRIEVAAGGRVRRVRWTLRPPAQPCGAVQVRGPTAVILP